MTDLWGTEARSRARDEAAQFRVDLARASEIQRAEGRWHRAAAVAKALQSWSCSTCGTRNHAEGETQGLWCSECGDDKP
jgi:hypothetical protein